LVLVPGIEIPFKSASKIVSKARLRALLRALNFLPFVL
jgi:hypothetical protein